MTLFDGPDLQHVLEAEADKAVQRAQQLPDEDVLGASVDEWTDRTMATIDLEPPQLYPEKAGGAQTWSGIGLRTHFSGTGRLFHYKPNCSSPAGPPAGLVVGNRVFVDLGPADP